MTAVAGFAVGAVVHGLETDRAKGDDASGGTDRHEGTCVPLEPGEEAIAVTRSRASVSRRATHGQPIDAWHSGRLESVLAFETAGAAASLRGGPDASRSGRSSRAIHLASLVDMDAGCS